MRNWYFSTGLLLSTIFSLCTLGNRPAFSSDVCTNAISAVTRDIESLGALVYPASKYQIDESPYRYGEAVSIRLGYATTGATITQSIVADHILLYNDDYARDYADRVIGSCPKVVSFSIGAYEYISKWVLMPNGKIQRAACVDAVARPHKYAWGTVPCL